MDVKSSMVEHNQKSTVTTNCHAFIIVHSHLQLLPLSFFFKRRCHCCHRCHGKFFSLFLATHAAKRSLWPDDQCPRLQCPSRPKMGGLPLPLGGSATNNAMSIPTAPTCFRSRGGTLTIRRAAILWQFYQCHSCHCHQCCRHHRHHYHCRHCCRCITVTIVTGCCHYCQENKFLTVFDMSYAFPHMETGGCCRRLYHRTEGAGSGKPNAWKIAPGMPEDLHFRGFFSVLAEVLVAAQDMMKNHVTIKDQAMLGIV